MTIISFRYELNILLVLTRLYYSIANALINVCSFFPDALYSNIINNGWITGFSSGHYVLDCVIDVVVNF